MPEQKTIRRSREDKRSGKAASTQAGEFVREEFHHIREGEHGARSTKQAIAIGLSKARRAGVRLPPPPNGKLSPRSQRQAQRDYESGSHPHSPCHRNALAPPWALSNAKVLELRRARLFHGKLMPPRAARSPVNAPPSQRKL